MTTTPSYQVKINDKYILNVNSFKDICSAIQNYKHKKYNGSKIRLYPGWMEDLKSIMDYSKSKYGNVELTKFHTLEYETYTGSSVDVEIVEVVE